MEELNSTMPETAGGEQAEAVAPQETPTEAAGQERVVDASDFDLVDVGEDDAQSAEPDGAGQADESEQTTKEPSETAERKPRKQSADENAAYHAMRLRAKREAEAEARAALDEEIAGLGIENPYNGGKPFGSLKELHEYSKKYRQDRIEAEAKKTGKSVQELTEDAENRAFLSSLRREAEAKRAAEAKKAQHDEERQAFIQADVIDFMKQHPEMTAEDLSALENNQQFRRFCGSRFGTEPLATLYGDYQALVGSSASAAVAKAEQRRARSTGGGSADGAVLSPAQKSALDAWNAEHPEMAMTAKEFLRR